MNLSEKKFGETMALLQDLYGKQLKPNILAVYWSYLKNFTEIEFDKAVEYIISNFKPTASATFPLIVHFRESKNGMEIKEAAVMAIDLLCDGMGKYGFYESVDFNDPVLHAVIVSYGGWREICGWSKDELSMRRSQMIETYRVFARNGRKYEGYMIGESEARNIAGGYDEWIKAPILINRDKAGRISGQKLLRVDE